MTPGQRGRYDEAIRCLREEVHATDAPVARVTARLDAARRPLGVTLDSPPDVAVARVKARLRARRRRPAWPRIAAPVLAAAAAALVLALWPEPEPLDAPLATAPDWNEIAATEHVVVAWMGEGHIGGAPDDVTIRWEVGTVEVSVEPEQGIDLAVVTAEARVEVVGTAFAVTRDVHGTHVEVRHGRVGVTCTGGPRAEHVVGDRVTCAPTTAAGRLARARAASDPRAALADADAGLPSASGAVLAELHAVRADALVALGRHGEALRAVGLAIAAGSPREADLRRLGAHLAKTTGDCAALVEHLDALPEDAWTDNDFAWRSRCP